MDVSTPLSAAFQASFPWLSLIVLLPAAGALLMAFLPGEEKSKSNLPRNFAITILLFDFLLIIGVIIGFFNQQLSVSPITKHIPIDQVSKKINNLEG